MRFLLVLYLSITSSVVLAQRDVHENHIKWTRFATRCVLSGEAQMMFAEDEAEAFAFACHKGNERFIFMLNLGDMERRIERSGEVEPLVPIFNSSGDISAIPSIVITIPGDGTVIHENPIPPLTLVVFRPIRQRDIRLHGLDE